MKRYAVQIRFVSDKYIQPWLTIAHCGTKASAEESIRQWKNPKVTTTEYRVIAVTI